jgi:hypothetical protein
MRDVQGFPELFDALLGFERVKADLLELQSCFPAAITERIASLVLERARASAPSANRGRAIV